MRRQRGKRREADRDLALAFLGAHNATDVELQTVIDRHIARVLAAADGNLSVTADLLGMHRRSLQRIERRKGRKRAARRVKEK
jgi:ActR/RegA family two-component response regulator